MVPLLTCQPDRHGHVGRDLAHRQRSARRGLAKLERQHWLAAAAVNAVFGLLAAWVLVRYQFPGKRIIDALIDLPFALPTAVTGITLTTLYAPNGWIGKPLDRWGVRLP